MGSLSEVQQALLQQGGIQIVQAPLFVETFGGQSFEFVWAEGVAEVPIEQLDHCTTKPKNTPHGPQRNGRGGKVRRY